MSLTKNDLLKIGNLIETKLEQKLVEKLEVVRQEIDDKISSVDSSMILLTKSVRRIEESIDEKLKPIKKSLHQIDRKLDATIEFFDHDVTQLKTRTTRIENHLGLSALQ